MSTKDSFQTWLSRLPEHARETAHMTESTYELLEACWNAGWAEGGVAQLERAARAEVRLRREEAAR